MTVVGVMAVVPIIMKGIQMVTWKMVLQLWKYPICTTLHQDCQWLREKSCYPDRNLRLQRRHYWTLPQGWDLCSPVLTKSATRDEIRSNENVSNSQTSFYSLTCGNKGKLPYGIEWNSTKFKNKIKSWNQNLDTSWYLTPINETILST
jgi:hypothetical protein